MNLQTVPSPTAFAPSKTFRSGGDMPRGSIGYHLDCSDNPLDLRPAAELILRAIEEQRRPNTPLVVLMGETHPMPTHIELQHLVARQLHDAGENFTFNFELPHNFWAQLAENRMGLKLPATLSALPSHRADPDGRALLSAHIGFMQAAFAPLSSNNLAAYCYYNAIKSSFNDAASDLIKNSPFLDCKNDRNSVAISRYKNSKTYKETNLFKRIALTLLSYINTLSPTGVAIRNRAMVQNALDHAQVHNAPLILQKTGKAHVFGCHGSKFLYADSLCAIFKESGADVLPIYLTSKTHNNGLNRLPFGVSSALPHSVVIDGLDDTAFCYTLNTPQKEQQFLQKIHSASGQQLTLYDDAINQQLYRKRAIMDAHTIIATHSPAPK